MTSVHQVFNSALVSGPETLVLPNIQNFPQNSAVQFTIVLLQEVRLPEGSKKVIDYIKSLGHQLHQIPVKSRFDLSAVYALSKYWKSTRPDIVHTHGHKAAMYSLLANGMLGGAKKPKMLTTNHGVHVSDLVAKQRIFEKIYERTVMPFYDLCLTVCTSDRDILIGRGIKSEKIQVHLNGVDRKLIAPEQRTTQYIETRKKWQRDYAPKDFDGFLIGVVGRLSPEKQHRRILQAMRLLLDRAPTLGAKLLCFGTGKLDAELKSYTTELNLDNHVYWIGYRNNVAEEMCGLDVLLSCSSAEGLPINLIEAGWSGTPVIATAVDGVCDLIESGQSGILLPSQANSEQIVEALLQLAAKDQATKMGHALQERVRTKFSKTAWVGRLEEVYKDLI